MNEGLEQDADLAEVRWVGDLQRVRLEPGDTLVLRCPGRLSIEAAARLKERLEATFVGHQAVVLGEGMDLGVVGTGYVAGERAEYLGLVSPLLARTREVHWAVVPVSMELMTEMYTAGWESGNIRCISGLPAGARFVGAAVEPLPRGVVHLVFEHESFVVSWPSQRLPEVKVVFEKPPRDDAPSAEELARIRAEFEKRYRGPR